MRVSDQETVRGSQQCGLCNQFSPGRDPGEPCGNCGLPHPRGRGNCRAQGQVCRNCGRLGHFTRVELPMGIKIAPVAGLCILRVGAIGQNGMQGSVTRRRTITRVYINSLPVHALIDTRADRCLICENFHERLLKVDPLTRRAILRPGRTRILDPKGNRLSCWVQWISRYVLVS